MDEPPTHEELQDLIDGRLRGARLLAVLGYLRDHAELAEHVQDLRATDAALRQFARHARSGWDARARRVGAASRAWLSARAVRAAAAVGAVAIGVLVSVWAVFGAPWSDRKPSAGTSDLVRVATTAHDRVARMGEPAVDFGAGAGDAFRSWSETALGTGVVPPDLSELGYTYAGARVFLGRGRPAGLLAYERANGETLSIYCWSPRAAAAHGPTHLRRNGYHVGLARRPHLGVAVVAPGGIDDFGPTAGAVFRTLDAAPADFTWPNTRTP